MIDLEGLAVTVLFDRRAQEAAMRQNGFWWAGVQAGALVVSALVIWGLGQAGLTARLGAHPFWAQDVPLTGLVLAVPIMVLAVWRPRLALVLSLLCLVAGALAARFGKAAFAASYAENALAGQFWFLGWIVLCGGACAALSLALLSLRSGTGRSGF